MNHRVTLYIVRISDGTGRVICSIATTALMYLSIGTNVQQMSGRQPDSLAVTYISTAIMVPPTTDLASLFLPYLLFQS